MMFFLQQNSTKYNNTQNASNSQPQPDIVTVESAPPNAGSNRVIDMDNQSKTTTPLQITPEEVEMNLPSVKESKFNKYENTVTTEKVQQKLDKIVEHVEGSNSIDESELTNFIDVGQQQTHNTSKYI